MSPLGRRPYGPEVESHYSNTPIEAKPLSSSRAKNRGIFTGLVSTNPLEVQGAYLTMSLKKALNVWDSLELYITGILAGIATAFAFYQVVMRYVFSESPEWAEESVLYLIIWAIFIISSKLVRDDEHVGADFVIRRLPYKVQRVQEIINCVLALSFLCIVIWYGFQIVSATFAMDERSTTRLRFPMWLAYLAIPGGSCLILLSYFRRLYLLIFQFDPKKFFHKHH